tara:strand:+ start:489 stop:707 length:219 start_codon:yes stop_codon:yes gene_type:complete
VELVKIDLAVFINEILHNFRAIGPNYDWRYASDFFFNGDTKLELDFTKSIYQQQFFVSRKRDFIRARVDKFI